MTRKEFLELMGIGLPLACLGCNKTPLITPQGYGAWPPGGYTDTTGTRPNTNAIKYPATTNPPPKIDFTIDVDDPANWQLKIPGGFQYFNEVIVALAINGQYIAAQEHCTHFGTSIRYSPDNDRYECPGHGSKFGKDGSVVVGPATTPVITYQTQLTGSLLRVFE